VDQDKWSSLDDLMKLLALKGIKPSFQRMKILEYILKEKGHPSADAIYRDLAGQIPTLSRTTIYNTLNLFTEKKIISPLAFSDSSIRYETMANPHAHFLCRACGRLYDVETGIALSNGHYIEGHRVEETHIHLKGICRGCLGNQPPTPAPVKRTKVRI